LTLEHIIGNSNIHEHLTELFYSDYIRFLTLHLLEYTTTNYRFSFYTFWIHSKSVFFIIWSEYDYILIQSLYFSLNQFLIELSILIWKWKLTNHWIVHYICVLLIILLFVFNQLFIPFLSVFTIQYSYQLINSTIGSEFHYYSSELYILIIKWFLLHVNR